MVELSESPIASPDKPILETSLEDIPVVKTKKIKKVKKSSTKKATPSKKEKKKKSSTENNEESVDDEPPKKKKKSETPQKKVKKAKKVDEDVSEEENNSVTVVDENSPEYIGDFSHFRITENTKPLLLKQGVKYLFPIQVKTFDHVFDGEDLIAQARTGTGKTLSFALPLIEKLLSKNFKRTRGRAPQVLVMTPTRELAIQVHDDFKSICQSLALVCVYGGSPYYPQESAMRSGVDIVVGTPGRILDHLKKGNLRLDEVNHVVLDEVDNMLDMGFAPTVEEILQYGYTQERENPPQTLLFSATCPQWVYKTAEKYMRGDKTAHVDTIGTSLNRTATTVEHLAIRCQYSDRAGIIGGVVQLHSGMHGRAMIFTDTKREANELVVCDALQQLKAQVLHGDIEQKQREITLKAYRDGTVKCLVATNVAARGLDIPEIDLVIQTSPPQDIESYIHRSGRTGRAGRTGVCVCLYKPREDGAIRKVEWTAGIKFKFVGPPQPKDIVKASIQDAMTSLESVEKAISAEFMEQAEIVAAKHEGGAVEALAAALAWISGAGKVKSRSLLSSQLGYTSWVMKADFEVRYAGFFYTTLEKNTTRELRDAVKGLRLTADKMGAVFDLPNHCTEDLQRLWTDSSTMTLAKAEELPELLEDNRNSQRSNNRYGDRSNSSYSRGRFSGGGSRGNGGGRGRSWGNNNFGGRSQGGNSRGGGGFRGGNRGGGFKRKWVDI
uniref:RNA helicase n=1 Tax=Phallusia mammillata TaxID=59560 RepID=A0A6F9DBG7_9ASCI|nr:nucleolar RNA helicase 2 [Phallusia mammillata]